jgi:hypothetical protein
MNTVYEAWDTSRKKMWSPEEMASDQLALLPDGTGFANISSTSTKLTQFLHHLIPLQFTGKCDKDGVRIFKGDLIRYSIQGIEQTDPIEVKW